MLNMLMEGYDHRYHTVLAPFRPYRSINAFAQIVVMITLSLGPRGIVLLLLYLS
ncbi:hypothetical protein D3C84_782540 [compost metagenome]